MSLGLNYSKKDAVQISMTKLYLTLRAAFFTLFCLSTLAFHVQSVGADFADPNKVLRTIFPVAETGFDPGVTRDTYSNSINDMLFSRLYTYDYLASPAKIVPDVAEGLPEIRDEGKTYLIRIKQGVYFAPDPAFGNKKRELVAEDFVYSFKRIMNPKISSSHTWLLDGKIIGLDEHRQLALKSGSYSYDTRVEGLQAIDRYTLQLKLKRPDYNLTMILAYTATSAVAREVIEKYEDGHGHVMSHPIGTGPYLLKEWVRGSKMVLNANPDFRPVFFNATASSKDDEDIIAAMKGKRLPQIGKIVVQVILEDQARLLAFQKDEADLFQLYGGLAPQVLDGGQLKPEFKSKGIKLSRILDLELSMYYFNMKNSVFAGMSKEKIALRRAIALAHNVEEEIRIVDNGDGVALEYPIPPGVVGHDPKYKSSIQFNPALANALLDKFGYQRGSDGWRQNIDGKELVVTMTFQPESRGHLQAEVWKKTYDSIGIKMNAQFKPFPEILKAEKNCQINQRISPWIADFPDGDNFMQLFYGRNINVNNNGCVAIPEFDALYEQSQRLPHGAERDLLYHKMTRILEVYSSQRLGYARYRNMLSQPRVIGFKKHPIMRAEWLYLDIKN